MAITVRGLGPATTESTCRVAGLAINVARAGQGTPLVYLHDSLGSWAWLPLHESLAKDYDVIVPDLPGFGTSERPTWARHARDLAVLIGLMCDELALDRPVLVGVGFGGWIAAELATMRPRQLGGLVLVGAAGLKPREGEIADQMLRGPLRYGLGGFRDADSFRTHFGIDGDVDDVPDGLYTLWDYATEMTARVCWKPWMFSLELPHVLPGLKVPARAVWGAEDGLVPLDIGRQYAELIPGATLTVVDGAGHWVDIEAPDHIVEAVNDLQRSAK